MSVQQRRQFLKSSAAMVGGMTALSSLNVPAWAIDSENRYLKDIGIQLYTLRDAIKADAMKTLAKVAEMGYQQVEAYGFPNCEPIIEGAKAAGLPIRSSHINADPIISGKDPDAIKGILEKATKLEMTDLVIPYLGNQYRKSLDDYKVICERFNQAAEETDKAGIRLAYHNHAFEFEPMGKKDDGSAKCGYDVMTEDFSEKMNFEVDVFWVHVGGVDPLELLKDLKGRVTQVHLKDLSKEVPIPTYEGVPKSGFEELGDGVVDITSVIAASEETGVHHCHVEQDHSPNPLGSIEQSLKWLQS